MKRLNPTSEIQTCRNPQLPPLEATDYRELPEPNLLGKSPKYRHHYANHGGIVAAAAGLLMLVMFVASVGYWAGLTYYWMQHRGGQADVRR